MQLGLVDEVGRILSGISTTNANGEKVTGFQGYPQRLPIQTSADEDPDAFFPYYIVRVLGATTHEDDDYWTWSVIILLGIHDADPDNGGHFSLLNAMTRITSRFGQEAVLGCQGHVGFRVLPEMEMQLQDEDTHPYFFGVVSLQVATPKITREDPY